MKGDTMLVVCPKRTCLGIFLKSLIPRAWFIFFPLICFLFQLSKLFFYFFFIFTFNILLILNWFYNLFRFIFYKFIIVSNKLPSIWLLFNFVSVYFFLSNNKIKFSFKKKLLIKSKGVHDPNHEFDGLTWGS